MPLRQPEMGLGSFSLEIRVWLGMKICENDKQEKLIEN